MTVTLNFMLYTTYVRPILEYASQDWSPVLKLNIDRVENVHRYFARRVLYRENLEYLNRSEYLGIGTLGQRRIKADLVLYFKLVSGETEIRANDLFRNANSQRGYNSQLATLYCRIEKRKVFWSNRLVRKWNCLTQDAASSSSTSVFKRKLQDMNFNGRGSVPIV